MNEGCVVVGKPHPSHPFTEPHPTVYKIARAVWKKKLSTYEIVDDEKSMFASRA